MHETLFDVIYKLSLIGTFGVLIWYTFETYKIRRINTQQRDLELLPAIIIYIKRQSGSEWPFIKNIGSGVAVNVKIATTMITEGKSKLKFNFHLVDETNILVPQEERMIGVNVEVNGQKSNSPLDNFLAYFDPSNLQNVRVFRKEGIVKDDHPLRKELHVKFKDITGQQYETAIEFSEFGISIAQVPKRI